MGPVCGEVCGPVCGGGIALWVMKAADCTHLPGIYCFENHPVSRVEVVGYVVSVNEREKLISYGGNF